MSRSELINIEVDHVRDLFNWMRNLDKKLEVLPEIVSMQATITATQRSLAQTNASVAETFRRAENRYKEMDERRSELVNLIATNDRVPFKTHVYTVIIAQVPTIILAVMAILGMSYLTNINILASLNKVELISNINSKKLNVMGPQVKENSQAVEEILDK